MAKEINYGQLTHKAFRGLIADVLSQVAREGLPGKHHFFIAFDTTHPGVDMAASLRDRYPGNMTIVIQEWFTDLEVMEDRFTITLNFGNVPEPIVIPFDAITTFADPSVEFGLHFEPHGDGEGADATQDSDDDEPPSKPTPIKGRPQPEGAVVSLDNFRKS